MSITHYFLTDDEGSVSWMWLSPDAHGVQVSLMGNGEAFYSIRNEDQRFVDSLTLFDVTDGLPPEAHDAIMEMGGNPDVALVVPREMLQ